jgi:hypothetical protein
MRTTRRGVIILWGRIWVVVFIKLFLVRSHSFYNHSGARPSWGRLFICCLFNHDISYKRQ